MTGWKLSKRGYRSMGLSVPDVITTLWNLSNTGFIAREESKQLSCSHEQRKSGFKLKHMKKIVKQKTA
jgi:hypothetical protein